MPSQLLARALDVDVDAGERVRVRADAPFAPVTERRKSRNVGESYRALSGDQVNRSSARIPLDDETSRFLGCSLCRSGSGLSRKTLWDLVQKKASPSRARDWDSASFTAGARMKPGKTSAPSWSSSRRHLSRKVRLARG